MLERRHRNRARELEAWVARHPAADRPLAVFGWLAEWYGRDGARGCAFLNAAAELADTGDPARRAVEREKRWLLGLLSDLAREAGLREPERTASQLLLLIDGVAGRAVVGGPVAARAAVEDARQAAERLVGGG